MWKNALEEKYISNDMITAIVDSELAKGGQNWDAEVSLLPNGYHAMRKPLYYKMQYCGFIGIYDYFREFTEEDRDSLGIIAKAVSALICNDKDFISYDDNAYSSLLYQMLGCKTHEEARHVLKKHTPLAFQTRKVLITIIKRKHVGKLPNIPLLRIRDLVATRLYHHYATVYEDKLVLLIEKERMDEALYSDTLTILCRYCREYGLKAGVSYEFEEDRNIPQAFTQSLFALQYEENKDIYYFDDYYLDSILKDCVEQKDMSYYIHPYILRIEAYDQTYNTHYMETLSCYLSSSGNMRLAAEELGIHYNSMKYRMSMIEEIVGEDIRDDHSLRMVLYLSVLFYERRK